MADHGTASIFDADAVSVGGIADAIVINTPMAVGAASILSAESGLVVTETYSLGGTLAPTIIVDIDPQTTGQLWPRSGGTTVSGTGDGGGGGAPTRYTHNQAVLAQVWTVVHGLGAHPAVAAEDAAGSVIYGTVQYLSDSTLTITFNRSATGRANCI